MFRSAKRECDYLSSGGDTTAAAAFRRAKRLKATPALGTRLKLVAPNGAEGAQAFQQSQMTSKLCYPFSNEQLFAANSGKTASRAR
jgi:hypothetical protein